MQPRGPLRFGRRRPWRSLAVMVALQVLAGVGLAVQAAVDGLAPDHGLQQIDLLMLRERVAGLEGTGRPTVVVAAGPVESPACFDQLVEASRRRDRDRGLDSKWGLIAYVPLDAHAVSAPSLPGVELRLDPDGALTRRLGLSRAATGCHPGYIVMDAAGVVRYRTYDRSWASHGGEQSVLLQAVA